MLRPRLLLTIVFAGLAAGAPAQQNRIDVVTPLAPELAAYGKYDIGVRTIPGDRQESSRHPEHRRRGGRRPLRSDADARSLVPGDAGGRPEAGRRLPRDHARSRRHRDAARQGGARRRAADHRRRLPARDHLARLSRQPLSHEPSRRKPREQGLRRRLDRSQGQHLRRSEGASPARSTTARSISCSCSTKSMRLGKRRLGQLSRAACVDASRTGIVGYSMGGYGVVNVIGGGYSKASETLEGAPPNQLLAERGAVEPRLPQDASIRGSRPRSRSRRGACRPDSGTPRG